MKRSFTSIHPLIIKTTASGRRRKKPISIQAVCWSREPSSLPTSWFLQVSAMRVRDACISLTRRPKSMLSTTWRIFCLSLSMTVTRLGKSVHFAARWSARSRRKAGPRLVNKSLPGLHRQGFMAAKFPRFEPTRLCCLGCNAWDLQQTYHKAEEHSWTEKYAANHLAWLATWDHSEVCSGLSKTSASLHKSKRRSLRTFLAQNLTLGLILSITISNLEPCYITVCVVTLLLIAVSNCLLKRKWHCFTSGLHHFGFHDSNFIRFSKAVDRYVSNRLAKFCNKIFSGFREIAIFVMGYFFRPHPVYGIIYIGPYILYILTRSYMHVVISWGRGVPVTSEWSTWHRHNQIQIQIQNSHSLESIPWTVKTMYTSEYSH